MLCWDRLILSTCLYSLLKLVLIPQRGENAWLKGFPKQHSEYEKCQKNILLVSLIISIEHLLQKFYQILVVTTVQSHMTEPKQTMPFTQIHSYFPFFFFQKKIIFLVKSTKILGSLLTKVFFPLLSTPCYLYFMTSTLPSYSLADHKAMAM